ncbi:cryptochrome/photolyase family protein [Croceimicrobium sp.]|uniref:cryptochrome/photolyase family protein n=1 Tax=Croceimicrobium sp. TaxID=2828340 RepID=UPI003BAD1D03
MKKSLHLILGDCLFPDHSALLGNESPQSLLFIEDYGLCTHFRYHKHKLLFFLTAMRHHAHLLQAQHEVHYLKLVDDQNQIHLQSFTARLEQFLNDHPEFDSIRCYEVDDRFFEEELKQWAHSYNRELEFVPSPKFLFPLSDFKAYLQEHKKPFLKTYYQRQRLALKILLDADNQPIGGQWSYDADNRKKLPSKAHTPPRLAFAESNILKEVKSLVAEHFSEHPGKVQDFAWATTREEALAVLDQFLQEKLALFGPYEDAFEAQQKFLYHSTLSPYLNCGLLLPEEVLAAVLKHYQKQDSHLPSVEGFVRQLIGWREFVRGMYRNFDFEKNHFGLQRKLSPLWYEANTGIPPLDDVLRKCQEEAYNHHIERLMIIGNTMLLCEIDPQEVYRWFMEMYIDSADWVMAANVFGMSQFADGGSFATKPYIAGSNYLRKMSHYAKGPWCDTMDGLYWRFIDQHRQTFAHNHRMSMMLGTLDRMEEARKKRIFKAAEDFIQKVSYLD